jgi:K+-sensing histidine kinase KdpD
VLHLICSLTATLALTAAFAWTGVTNPTIVALALLLVVLVTAAVSSRSVAISTSLAAFFCFNFFFLPPVGTLAIADPAHWVALFTLLAVSVIGSHLSTQARERAKEMMQMAAERADLLEERKEAELVRRTAELKSALLAALGHDLKTPLTALTVAANNLTASWLDEEGRREQADIVTVELARLNRLFEDIVDMARIDTHAVNAEPEWVQPSEIIEAAARQAEQSIADHHLSLGPQTDPVLVRVDPRLTSAALAHLLENAGQYSPPGSRIEVAASFAADELLIRVRDFGGGIAAGELEDVFARTYRGSDARKWRFGTGMGLSISRGLLAAQGGRVWAENHPAGGAVFTIAVPAATRQAAALTGDLE